MNLQLSLKREWFEMTKAGIKTEDYREITPYFCNKFLLYQNESKSKNWWFREFFEYGTIEETIECLEIFGYVTFKPFLINIMTLGYPKKGDPERTVTPEHKGIEIRTGNTEWGAEEGKIYFVIKHGEKL